MIEAALMAGGILGPASPWTFVGGTSLLHRGFFAVQAGFPEGIQDGDLVVALMSPLDETLRTTMAQPGEWMHLTPGRQDYLCTARYSENLPPPIWIKEDSNTLFVSTLVFRARGWSTVRLESNASPAVPVSVDSEASNRLLLNIGITPKTARIWTGHMPNLVSTARIERALAPALQVYSANMDSPGHATGIYADASAGVERNLILSAF